MSHWIEKALHFMPFMVMATQGPIQMNKQRIFEAVLIAVLTAAATGYSVTIRLEERDRHQTDQLIALTAAVKELNKEINNAKVQMGDRWTGSMQREYEREHEMRHRDHEHKGHWNATNNSN